MKKTKYLFLVAAIVLSVASVRAEEVSSKVDAEAMPKGLEITGITQIDRKMYTTHFADGTVKVVPGKLDHMADNLPEAIRKKVDGFFKKQSDLAQKASAPGPDQGTRVIEAVTETDVRASVLHFQYDGVDHIVVVPAKVVHQHGDNPEHQKQVETLFSLSSLSSMDDSVKIPGLSPVNPLGSSAVGLIGGPKPAPAASKAINSLMPTLGPPSTYPPTCLGCGQIYG